MVQQKLYVVLALGCLAFAAHASDYVLYSPDNNKGGEVAADGTWQITDECAASRSFQEQE
jgi:hypothetical protein